MKPMGEQPIKGRRKSDLFPVISFGFIFVKNDFELKGSQR